MNKEWQTPYGAYECLVNAVAYILYSNNCDINSLYSVNWDIYYNREFDLIGGNVPNAGLIRYLTEANIAVAEVGFADIPDDQPIIIALNAKDLFFLEDYYRLHDHVHRIPAIKRGDAFVISDPFHKIQAELSVEQCFSSWSTYQRAVLVLTGFNQFKPAERQEPYLMEADFEARYERCLKEITLQFDEFAKVDPDQSSMKFKRYFGCVRAIQLNRAHYLWTFGKEYANSPQIIRSWSGLAKEFTKLTLIPEYPAANLHKALQQAMEAEVAYLHHLKRVR